MTRQQSAALSFTPMSELDSLIRAGLGSVPQDEILPWQREAALSGRTQVELTPRQKALANAELHVPIHGTGKL